MTRRTSHYCRTCRRSVPLAPGIRLDGHLTVGVAHVQLQFLDPLVFMQNPPCRDCVQRTYEPEQQEQNLRDMDLED